VTTTSNVTGINFTASTVVYNTLASDNFTRANENPLSQGGNWSAVGGAFDDPLQVVSNACEGTSTDPSNIPAMQYSGLAWPNDCWMQGTIASASNLNDTVAFML